MPGRLIGTLIWLFCLLFVGGVCLGMGIKWSKGREPAGPWAKGKAPKRTDFTDVDAYNRAMGRQLKLYSIPFFLAAVCFFWRPLVAGILAAVTCIPGLILLLMRFGMIYQKYIK